MKRFHAHISVNDLQANIEFYTGLFGQEPSKRKEDYAKWMLDDPRVNFAISSRGHRPGL
ncbi:MAG TPA: VOC family protein, partial [Fibrobacteria bacterium]|nr:VOC family protein [Fibrobacteria bacterium]